jgi:RHS repeat-associated protein
MSSETDSYGYDLQNRLATANISRTEQGQAVVIAANYSYDDAGFRAQGVVTTTIGTGSPTTTTTQYLVDVMNPTGYTQVLEEHTNGSATPGMSYLVGLSVFGQTDGAGATKYFLTDGQGSTRQVVDALGNITARFAYDAYGNLLGMAVGVLNPPPTKILYTGQQLDSILLQYYLRARFFNSRTGEFRSMDAFPGRIVSPTSLHRYIYSGNNPINEFDPSGQDGELSGTIGTIGISTALGALTGGALFHLTGGSLGEGLLVGGEIGLALSFAYIQGRLGEAIAYGVAHGLASLIAEGLVRTSIDFWGLDPLPEGGAWYARAFLRGFAAGAMGVAFEWGNDVRGGLVSGAIAGFNGFINDLVHGRTLAEAAERALSGAVVHTLLHLVIGYVSDTRISGVEDIVSRLQHDPQLLGEIFLTVCTGGPESRV